MRPHDHTPEPLRSEFADDPEMSELIGFFVEELPERLDRLMDSWRDQRFEELQRIAHQLKGASGGYGFSPVGEAAARLENSIKTEAAMEQLQQDVDSLLNLCRRVSA